MILSRFSTAAVQMLHQLSNQQKKVLKRLFDKRYSFSSARIDMHPKRIGSGRFDASNYESEWGSPVEDLSYR